jgi:peptidoglycan hydrolase-like protein with peptidoglycan-binding domain
MKKRTTSADKSRLSALSPEWQRAIDAFLEFRKRHRGVSDSTLGHYRIFLGQFAQHVSTQTAPVRPDELEANHIDSFLISGQSFGRDWSLRATSTLRVFLRHLAMLGQLRATLASQVTRPRTYRLAGLPRTIDEADLRRVLRSIPRRDAAGRREYAILILVSSRPGVRRSMVRSLPPRCDHHSPAVTCARIQFPHHRVVSEAVSETVRASPSTVDLNKFLNYIATSSDARTPWVRGKLNAAGFPTGSTDAALATAIRGFQAAYGLSVDGVIGPMTWAALCAS